MLLAEGGYRVTWDCGAVKVRGQGTGAWEFVDLDLLEADISHEHLHRHHMSHHRAKGRLPGSSPPRSVAVSD